MEILMKFEGGCHCGEVKFEVLAPQKPIIIHCNCSICEMKQNHHFIVPKANFRMVKGKDFIKTYTFNSHKAQHMFCSICGVQSFYIPRSNQDGYGIMPHCISGNVMDKSNIQIFNGQNWDEEIKRKCHIKELSKVTGDSSRCSNTKYLT